MGVYDFLFVLLIVQDVLGQIYIEGPGSVSGLFNGGYIQGSTAAFGTPTYGSILMGQLVYGESDSKHCENDYSVKSVREHPKYDASKIIIVQRGECHFVKKVRIAQKDKEAAAVIVVDDDITRTDDDIRLIIMADDGWGSKDITIPSILINKENGDRLIESGTKEDVLVSLRWDVPNAKRVSMDLWLTPSLRESNLFLNRFAPIAFNFKEKLKFEPHYYIVELGKGGIDLCTDKGGMYCALDPDRAGPVTGADVVKETVRQKCIYNLKEEAIIYKGTGEVPPLFDSFAYWRYVQAVYNECPTSAVDGKRLTDECSYALMDKLSIDVNAVRKCYDDNFYEILDYEKDNFAWSSSALMINNWRYAGDLEAESVKNAICTGFESRPDTCIKAETLTIKDHDKMIKHLQDQTNKFPWWILVTVSSAVIGLVAIGLICYRICIRKKIRNQLRYEIFEEVKNQMKDYSKGEVKTPETTKGDVEKNDTYKTLDLNA